MSVKLFKVALFRRYPEMAMVPVFDRARFAEQIANVITVREISIAQIVHVTDHLKYLRLKQQANREMPCELEQINIREEEMGLTSESTQLDVLVAVAHNDRNSSGGDEDDVDDRVIRYEYRARLREALHADVLRVFMPLTVEKQRKHAKVIAGFLHVSVTALERMMHVSVVGPK